MDIKTKFEPGDTVSVLHLDSIQEYVITKCTIVVSEGKIEENYSVRQTNMRVFPAKELFKSKEELIKSL